MSTQPNVVFVGARVRSLAEVRGVVNERAAALRLGDAQRLRAIGVGLTCLQNGHTIGWAIAEACRSLRGLAPGVHAGRPTPPAAA